MSRSTSEQLISHKATVIRNSRCFSLEMLKKRKSRSRCLESVTSAKGTLHSNVSNSLLRWRRVTETRSLQLIPGHTGHWLCENCFTGICGKGRGRWKLRGYETSQTPIQRAQTKLHPVWGQEEFSGSLLGKLCHQKASANLNLCISLHIIKMLLNIHLSQKKKKNFTETQSDIKW